MDEAKTRRKLIQGTLAAPLVLTVSKAGAASRTTFSACLANSELRPEPAAVVSSGDEAFRITRDVYELYRPGKRDNEVAKKVEGQYVLGWDNRTFYRIDGGRLAAQHDNSATFMAGGLDVEMRRTGRKVHLLAYLDDTGNVVGLAPQKNGGSWCMKSCYASLVGMSKQASSGWRRFWA
jgi:hypothetical protein